jgi:hypothetical protein
VRNTRIDRILDLIDSVLDEFGTPSSGRPSYPTRDDVALGGFGMR